MKKVREQKQESYEKEGLYCNSIAMQRNMVIDKKERHEQRKKERK